MPAPLVGSASAEFPDQDCGRLADIAWDIERYPEFIPWCLGVRVTAREPDRVTADLAFGARMVRVGFAARLVRRPPAQLEITSADGPFSRFRLLWRFVPLEGGGCRVVGDYELQFRSPMLQALARMTAAEAERRVMHRFAVRARQIFG